MASPSFRRFLSRNAARALEKQLHLYDEVGSPDWEADLATGVLTLGNRAFPMQLLGTESVVSRTWRWAWANTSPGVADHVLATARQLRSGDQTSAIEEFTTSEWPLEHVDGHQLSAAASGHLGGEGAFYRGPYDGGAAYFYLPEGLVIGRPTPERVARVLLEAISIWELDHRLLVEGYAADRGLALDQRDDWYLSVPTQGLQDGTVRMRFDRFDRLAAVDVLSFPA